MLKIAVLVSGGGTNLGALIAAQAQNTLGGTICAVISNKSGVYALERARDNGIPALTVERKDFKNAFDFSRAMERALEPYAPDLIVLAGFLSILDEGFCKSFENKIINIHPALIPSFCGKGMYGIKVHEAALAKGVRLSGATVHFVNAEPDGGAIILQKAVPVCDGDTAQSLQQRIMEQAEQKILPLAVRLFCEGRLKPCGAWVKISNSEEQEI